MASDDKDEQIKNAKMSSSLQSDNHLIAALAYLGSTFMFHAAHGMHLVIYNFFQKHW